MPTPIMDLKGLSSPSYFSEDSCFPSEAEVTSCKSETLPDQYGTVGRKSFAAPPFQKFVSVDSETTKSMNRLEPFPVHHQKVNLSLDQEAVRAANGNRTASGTADSQTLSLLRSLDHKSGSVAGMNALQAPYFSESNRVNASIPPYENSLFSSSLPNLFSRKMKLSSRNTHFEHSVDTVPSHYDEGEPFTSLEEIEAQTIGNLLPDDDDLLSGVTDGLDFVMQSNGDDLEELDFFSNVGGMDLEDCDSSMSKKYIKSGSNGSTVGEHPYGENPSRTLFVRNINSNVEDSELRVLFEQYGEIRSLYTACKQRGFVMISYYDIRAARKAMESLQNRPMRGRRLDIHYSIPKDNPSDKEVNQGMLALSNLESSISNDELHHIFCAYGDVKEIQNIPHRNHQKLVEHFDIRAAEAAFRALNRSNIAGKQIKIEPVHPGGMKDIAIDLEQDESDLFLQQSSPSSHSAPGFAGRVPLAALNSSSRENGTSLGMQSAVQLPFLGSPAHNGISSSVPDGLSSLLRVESAGRQSVLVDSGHSQGQLKFDIREPANFHPHSLPEYQDSFVNGIPNSPNLMGTNFSQRAPETIDNRQLHRISSDGHSLEQGVFGSAGSGSSPLTGHHFMWGNTYRSQAPGMMWPNSPSFVNGIRQAPSPARLHGLHGTPSPMLNTVLPTNNHHVGSAPAVNPTIWDRQQPYAVGSPETSVFHPGSLGNMRISKSTLHSLDFVPHNIFSHVGGNCVDLPISSKVMGLQSPHQRCMMYPGRGQIMPGLNSFDPPSERVRSRRNEGASSQADKKQYELDIERIIRGEDNRTTLMIKNIPNKYTSKMLLAAIDEQHRGTYDFIYLPIDFKNKCNVGYAFINMTDPNQIIPFYKAFNGKKWEKFNSEKVASLAYARIQGKSALIAHFQNSSLMNEDKRCRPILFNTEGPNAGDQVPFPMGVNVRSRPGKTRSSSFEENHQGAIGGDSSNRDPSTSPTRDSE